MTNEEIVRETGRFRDFLSRCEEEARAMEREWVEPHHALLALLQAENTLAFRILESYGVTYWKVRRMVLDMGHVGWDLSSERTQQAAQNVDRDTLPQPDSEMPVSSPSGVLVIGEEDTKENDDTIEETSPVPAVAQTEEDDLPLRGRPLNAPLPARPRGRPPLYSTNPRAG